MTQFESQYEFFFYYNLLHGSATLNDNKKLNFPTPGLKTKTSLVKTLLPAAKQVPASSRTSVGLNSDLQPAYGLVPVNLASLNSISTDFIATFLPVITYTKAKCKNFFGST